MFCVMIYSFVISLPPLFPAVWAPNANGGQSPPAFACVSAPSLPLLPAARCSPAGCRGTSPVTMPERGSGGPGQDGAISRAGVAAAAKSAWLILAVAGLSQPQLLPGIFPSLTCLEFYLVA